VREREGRGGGGGRSYFEGRRFNCFSSSLPFIRREQEMEKERERKRGEKRNQGE
jgi:hypothetical protein